MLTVEAHDDAFWAKEFLVQFRSDVKDFLQLISNPSTWTRVSFRITHLHLSRGSTSESQTCFHCALVIPHSNNTLG